MKRGLLMKSKISFLEIASYVYTEYWGAAFVRSLFILLPVIIISCFIFDWLMFLLFLLAAYTVFIALVQAMQNRLSKKIGLKRVIVKPMNVHYAEYYLRKVGLEISLQDTICFELHLSRTKITDLEKKLEQISLMTLGITSENRKMLLEEKSMLDWFYQELYEDITEIINFKTKEYNNKHFMILGNTHFNLNHGISFLNGVEIKTIENSLFNKSIKKGYTLKKHLKSQRSIFGRELKKMNRILDPLKANWNVYVFKI